jgi:hypothetical protein
MMKKGPNQYVPGILNIKLNICDLAKNANNTNFLTYFGIDFTTQYASVLHECPYKVFCFAGDGLKEKPSGFFSFLSGNIILHTILS